MVNRKGQVSTISLILVAFVIAIIGVISISIIAEQTGVDANPTIVDDEALSIATARLVDNEINTTKTFSLSNLGLQSVGGWETDSVIVYNSTGTSMAGNYTVDYDAQTISFLNNTFMVSEGGAGNDTLVDYKYYQASYLEKSFARNIMNNILVGIYAILILVAVIGLLYVILQKMNK